MKSKINTKNRQLRKHNRVRSARGSAIIYGTLAVSAILLASAVITVLVLNVGYCTLNDEKLARVNVYAAQYAAAHSQDGTSEEAIKTYTEQLMLAMGMTPKNVSISITSTTTNYGPSVQVTVANQFGLLGSRGLLPDQVTMHETVASTVGPND